ncbi:MAG: hypothetical protein ACOZAI_02040 [Pseudomonadota bacterium]
MHRFVLPLLLVTCLGQAWADERTFDAGRLRQQIERHAEQASKTLPAPAGGEAPWMHETRRETPYGQERTDRPHLPPDGASRMRDDRGGGGYGRGYEMRYGPGGGMSPGSGGRGGRR